MLYRLAPFLCLPALVAGQSPLPALDRTVLAMGTELRVHLAGADQLGIRSEAVLAEGARIEAACSTWNPGSVWSQLNAAQANPVAMTQEWLDLLTVVKTWQVRTEGAFDPVLMALMQAWGTRSGGRTPDPDLRQAALRASGAHLLALDSTAGTARLLDPAAGVEEGGFLKGYALDRMRLAADTPEGLLDFGGQLLAWGRPVTVAIADPGQRQRPRLTLQLHNASLSGSGTSARGRHLLDPRTGQPCAAWGSTAVVAAEALTADVLSTALYAMGPDQGLAWAWRQGVAAAFLLNDGTIRLTPAFQQLHPSVHKEQP